MRTTWIRIWLALLILGCAAMVGPRAELGPQEKGDAHGDAYTFLDGVLKDYASAKTYHIEFVEEANFKSDMRRYWEQRVISAVVLPDRRYRFEQRNEFGLVLQVSDGVSEWIYLAELGQYTKEPTPTLVPGPIPNVPIFGIGSIRMAQRVLRTFSGVRSLIRSARFLHDEKIEVNGQRVLCTVVQAEGVVPGSPGAKRKINTTFTFWIDKKDEVIWKQTEHREGPLNPEAADTECSMDRTTWFKVSEPDAQRAPEELFVFKPTEGVEYVKEFTNPREKIARGLQGKQVPAVNLKGSDGKTASLESFQGKPLLLDFWATWCAPCVESLPALEKLYKDAADKGLVVLSIDSDEAAQTATEFLAKRKEPWANFHLTDEVAAAFPEHGIPYFVLVDASGKVVYAWEGLDEDGLRAAVAKLGPAFAGVAKSSESLPKP